MQAILVMHLLMIMIGETEAAETLLLMAQRNLLKQAPKEVLRAVWEEAYDQMEEPERLTPDSLEAAEESAYRTELFLSVTRTLREQEISYSRLEKIAEAGRFLVEPEFVLLHNPA